MDAFYSVVLAAVAVEGQAGRTGSHMRGYPESCANDEVTQPHCRICHSIFAGAPSGLRYGVFFFRVRTS
jgi:hypothetical protein